jgi:hypothetical protein
VPGANPRFGATPLPKAAIELAVVEKRFVGIWLLANGWRVLPAVVAGS